MLIGLLPRVRGLFKITTSPSHSGYQNSTIGNLNHILVFFFLFPIFCIEHTAVILSKCSFLNVQNLINFCLSCKHNSEPSYAILNLKVRHIVEYKWSLNWKCNVHIWTHWSQLHKLFDKAKYQPFPFYLPIPQDIAFNLNFSFLSIISRVYITIPQLGVNIQKLRKQTIWH